MDRLWSPWRYRYVSTAPAARGCIFCDKLAADDDRGNYIVLRAERNFLLLNLYPYTNGHLMIAPFQHVATLAETPEETLAEMMHLTRRAEQALRDLYKPDGINLGMNLGESAGRRRGGPHSHARAAALDRRRQLHDHRRRNARAAGKRSRSPTIACARRYSDEPHSARKNSARVDSSSSCPTRTPLPSF